MRFILQLLFVLLLSSNVLAEVRFLSLSDIHYGRGNTPGDGHDTGDQLLALSLNKVRQLSHRVDFIVTLGDFPTHMLFSSPNKEQYIATVFHKLYQANRAKVPMFYITGNNDSLKGNYQPFSFQGKSPLTLANDWAGACAHCEGLLIDDTHLQSGGYYSSYVIKGNKNIILIALNTTPFTKLPRLLPSYPNQQRDALIQLDWLAAQLRKYHTKQLIIALHVPPGTDYQGRRQWHEPYVNRLIELLNHDAHHFGEINLLTAHTHMDDIRRIRLNDGKNIYAYATPSVSRVHHNYPAVKVFELNNDFKLSNYTTYYTTTDDQWKNLHYSAVAKKPAIFSEYRRTSLADCLNGLTDTAACQKLQEGFYYSVKNPRVDASVCRLTLPVN